MTTFIGILRQIKILVHGKIIDIIITMAEYSSIQGVSNPTGKTNTFVR